MVREIAGEQYFYPKVTEIISASLELKEGKVILLIGQPGSGKSVFMSQLYDALHNKKVDYLTAIRAEFLQERDRPKDVYELFVKAKDKNKPKILILDSLDVLAYSRRRELQEWLFYIDKLKNIKGMAVICSSRTFEAEYLYPMNQQKWSEKVNIELLPDNFINKVFKKLRYDYSSITPRFREFLRIPLNLRITADIIKNEGDPKDISTLQGLYAKLCELVNISTSEMSLLTILAEQMIHDRTTHLSYPSINVQLFGNIKKIERPGLPAIIQIDSKNQRLSFSHQTLIDYFVAWKVINENKSIVDFVLEHGQSLFLRPTIRHILGFLRSSSKRRLFGELSRLFFEENISKKIGFEQGSEKIRMYIKTAVLADIASWGKPTAQEGRFLLRLFREVVDNQSLVIQFFNSDPNADWYDILKGLYILPILNGKDDSNIEYRLVLSFLATITKNKPQEILDISSLLLTKKYNRTVEWFFRRVSDDLHSMELDSSLKKKYGDFLEQTIRKGYFGSYYEIRVFCTRIARYFPKRALKLYFDCVMEELQDKSKKVKSSQGSLTESFGDVLPAIYERIPYQVMSSTTEFFEQILSESYSGEKTLPDWPDDLLYSKHAQRFGLNAFYEWYKKKILEFCINLTEEAKQITKKLQDSKWESQRQLSMLCKRENASYYKDDILNYIERILESNLKDETMYRRSELYIRLLEKGFESMPPKKREQVITTILNLKFDDELQLRIRLWKPLHHIPKRFHTKAIKRRLDEIQKKYNFEKEYRYRAPMSSTGFQAAQPPVPAEILRAKTPNELYDFLIENRQLKERWDFEENKFFGGVEELAQVTAGVFLEDLEKYKDVIENLAKDSANDEYIVWLFSALSKKDFIKKYIDWVIEMIAMVYERERLQLEIVRYLREIAENISKEQLDKLRYILLDLSKAKDPEEDKFFEYRKQGYSNDALTEGINSTRGVLAEVVVSLLSRFKQDYLIRILDTLSNDKTISVRAALVRYLPYAIKSLGWDKCFAIFSNLFQKGPEEYSELISRFLQYTPKEKFDQLQEVFDKLKEKREGTLGEALATVMTIYYLRGVWSEESLIELLKDKQLLDKGKEESFNLLANQVRFEANVDKCLKIINSLLEQEDVLEGKVSILFMQARIEDLKKFVPIIEKIVKKPKIRGESLYYVFEYLEKCILVDPLEVFGLLEEVLLNVGDDFYNMTGFIPASHSKAPLNIINTILECYPEEEERALKALDRLIELRWQGVDDYLRAFDRL